VVHPAFGAPDGFAWVCYIELLPAVRGASIQVPTSGDRAVMLFEDTSNYGDFVCWLSE
jgi:hypothetical protein